MAIGSKKKLVLAAIAAVAAVGCAVFPALQYAQPSGTQGLSKMVLHPERQEEMAAGRRAQVRCAV